MNKLLWKRWGWFLLLWVSSVAGLALIAFFFRFLMTSAGLRI